MTNEKFVRVLESIPKSKKCYTCTHYITEYDEYPAPLFEGPVVKCELTNSSTQWNSWCSRYE